MKTLIKKLAYHAETLALMAVAVVAFAAMLVVVADIAFVPAVTVTGVVLVGLLAACAIQNS